MKLSLLVSDAIYRSHLFLLEGLLLDALVRYYIMKCNQCIPPAIMIETLEVD